MINTSDTLMILSDGETLHQGILKSMSTATALLETQLGSPATQENIVDYGFYRLLGAYNHIPRIRFDKAFLHLCFDISQSDSQSTLDGSARKELQRYLRSENLPAHGFGSLRRGLKLMLVELWRTGFILLPTTFRVAAHFPIALFKHPLLNWVHGFKPNTDLKPEPEQDLRRLYYYGPRLLWTASWFTPKDVSLDDIADLHRASALYRRQISTTVIAGGTQLPFGLLPAKILQHFPLEASFTAEELSLYSQWMLTRSHEKHSFEEFRALTAERSTSQEKTRATPGAERPRKERPQTPPFFIPSITEDAHAVLEKNFKNLRRGSHPAADWRTNDIPSYVHREYVNLKEIAPHWVKGFRAYLHHRKYVKGARSDGEAVSALNLLADYIFFYLPWWRELAASPKVTPPSSPKAFMRFAFVTRHTTESLDDLPATLLTAIAWKRKSNETRAAAIIQISQFFSFIESHFYDTEEIAGRDFRSPLDPHFDAPRVNSRSKTTKEIIPKNLFGHLVFYAYAVEDAAMQLECKAKNNTLSSFSNLNNERWLKLSDYGVSASVRHRGAEYPLDYIPNVLQWKERTFFTGTNGKTCTAVIPHASVLRLLIGSVETGLRCQSIQWLDRESWRKEAKDWPENMYAVPLYINADKTKQEPWITYVVYRVRDLFSREEAFQQQFVDSKDSPPVYYEYNKDTPFAPLRPLFRSPNRPGPVGDTLYADYWRLFMVGFEMFYRQVSGEKHVHLHRLRPVRNADGEIVVRTPNQAGNLWCPMSLLAVHTPHACRATFVTNRKGILELSDAAQLLGHSSTVVTAHYDKPSIGDLIERLEQSDAKICQDFELFERDSESRVRADIADSALVRSFSRDREATVKTFNFIPSLSLWSTEESAKEPEGLRLLREGPMSRIRFRETHICPVGEECPQEVIKVIGEPRRCGCCPLAMRCIDHLPAIAAKRNQLLERVRFLHAKFLALQEKGEPSAVLDEVWEAMELDVNEYLGWQLSEEILNGYAAQSHGQDSSQLHVEQPDVVKRHLRLVTRSSGMAELMLHRIADCNAYPSLTTPQVQLAASQLKRKLLAGSGLDAIDWSADATGDVADVARMLSQLMKATGVSTSELATLLSRPLRINQESKLLEGK